MKLALSLSRLVLSVLLLVVVLVVGVKGYCSIRSSRDAYKAEVLTCATLTPTPAPKAIGNPETMAQAILVATNEVRTKEGLQPLIEDSNLDEIAQLRSSDMIAKSYFGHVSPTGETAFKLMDQYRILYLWAGENLARNNYSDDQTVEVSMKDWMESNGHRENILNPHYKKMGIGVARDLDMKYFTVVFLED
jgi:uncharacterized protein YkwD